LTIFQDEGTWHIEQHNVIHPVIATDTTDIQTVTLDKPGTLLNVTSVDSFGDVIDGGFVTMYGDPAAFLTNVIGTRITSLLHYFRNGSVSFNDCRSVVAIWVRDSR